MTVRPFLWLLLAGSAVAGSAGATGEITIYRCTDAEGRVALRDTPCTQGEQQRARAMQRPRDPAPRPRPAVAVPPVAVPAPAAAPAEARFVLLTPPRPMYECVTPDGERYASDTPEGNPRWVPLWTVGYPPILPRNPLGDRVGAPRPRPPRDRPGPPQLPPAIGLALTPGTWVRDRCHALPQEETCARLDDQRDELERRWFNAQPSERERIRLQQRGLDARLRNDCRLQ